jgi:hypothetical protein
VVVAGTTPTLVSRRIGGGFINEVVRLRSVLSVESPSVPKEAEADAEAAAAVIAGFLLQCLVGPPTEVVVALGHTRLVPLLPLPLSLSSPLGEPGLWVVRSHGPGGHHVCDLPSGHTAVMGNPFYDGGAVKYLQAVGAATPCGPVGPLAASVWCVMRRGGDGAWG